MLDPIVAAYVERHLDAAAIAKLGFDPSVVADVIRRIDGSEYKRRQAAPGIKISSKAFGVGRRYPIAAEYRFYRVSGSVPAYEVVLTPKRWLGTRVLGLEASVEVRTFRPARLDEMDDLESPSLQAKFTDSPSNLRGDQKDRFRPKKTSTDANARTYHFGQSGERQLAPQFGFRA